MSDNEPDNRRFVNFKASTYFWNCILRLYFKINLINPTIEFQVFYQHEQKEKIHQIENWYRHKIIINDCTDIIKLIHNDIANRGHSVIDIHVLVKIWKHLHVLIFIHNFEFRSPCVCIKWHEINNCPYM